MEIIQIGSLAILLKWLILGVSVIIGVMYIKLRNKDNNDSKLLLNLLMNSLFLSFFIWKGSLLFLEPSLVIKSPLSLLYFTGGDNGLIVAYILSSIYYFYKGRTIQRNDLTKTIFEFSFVVLAMYHVLSAIFLDGLRLYHLLIGVYSLLVLLFRLLSKNDSLLSIYIFTILFGFLNIILSFFIAEKEYLFLFTFQQWFYILLIVGCLYLWNKERLNEESC
ncbi:hypothetical protein FZW96_15385 [Bacillus sp. BGMRC 2118]|nr:hypothetical protein FZW96_15385 [Bacillus sp. BGMRC 2118]